MCRLPITLPLGLLLLLLGACTAVREGDEVYEVEDPNGVFVVFANKAIHFVNAGSLQVVKTITQDQSGQPLTNAGSVGSPVNTSRTWNDAAFLQDPTYAYVFVNEGDIYQDQNGTEYSYVTVIDTISQDIVGRVRVGALPVHGYSVVQRREYWAHSDVTGEFFVISLDNINATEAPVADFKTNTGHGKLLLDNDIYPRAYATNVNEQVLEEINLDTQQRTASFNYSAFLPDPTACTGTHSIGYSNISRHVYVECADNTGFFEWDAVHNTFVHFFGNITGYVSVAPADDKILVVGYDDYVNVLQPTSNGQPAEEQYTVYVPGKPDLNPVYWSRSTGAALEAARNYLVFFALTANVNIHNLQAAAKAGDLYPSDAYANAPSDCQYANYTSANAAAAASSNDVGLLLANGTDGRPLTPACGACAPGFADNNPADFNASMSGLRYINLTTIEAAAASGTDAEAALIPAGAVQQQVNTDSGANQCSFGEADRKAKRGGSYVAVVADLPSPSLYVIDPATQTLHGAVATAPHPTTLAWAPLRQQVSAASVSPSG